MKNSSVFISTLMVAMLVSGCGEENGEENNTTELEGTWSDTCEDWGDGTSSKGSLTLSGEIYSFLSIDYSDSVCSAVDSIYTGSGTFGIGSTMTTSSGLSAKKIDVTLLKDDGQDVNEKFYDIFRIDNGTLYFGDTDGVYDGESVENRPIDLDFNYPYTKN